MSCQLFHGQLHCCSPACNGGRGRAAQLQVPVSLSGAAPACPGQILQRHSTSKIGFPCISEPIQLIAGGRLTRIIRSLSGRAACGWDTWQAAWGTSSTQQHWSLSRRPQCPRSCAEDVSRLPHKHQALPDAVKCAPQRGSMNLTWSTRAAAAAAGWPGGASTPPAAPGPPLQTPRRLRPPHAQSHGPERTGCSTALRTQTSAQLVPERLRSSAGCMTGTMCLQRHHSAAQLQLGAALWRRSGMQQALHSRRHLVVHTCGTCSRLGARGSHIHHSCRCVDEIDAVQEDSGCSTPRWADSFACARLVLARRT